LHRHETWEFGKPMPERRAQRTAAHRRLQVESEERQHIRNRGTVCQQTVIVQVVEPGKRQQNGIVAQVSRNGRFSNRLTRTSNRAGDQCESALVAPRLRFCNRGGGQLQHRPQKSVLPECELGGVYGHGNAAGPGVYVVLRELPLTLLIEGASGRERKRVCRYHLAIQQVASQRIVRHGVCGAVHAATRKSAPRPGTVTCSKSPITHLEVRWFGEHPPASTNPLGCPGEQA